MILILFEISFECVSHTYLTKTMRRNRRQNNATNFRLFISYFLGYQTDSLKELAQSYKKQTYISHNHSDIGVYTYENACKYLVVCQCFIHLILSNYPNLSPKPLLDTSQKNTYLYISIKSSVQSAQKPTDLKRHGGQQM